MVQHRRTCWKAQRGCFLPILVRTNRLRRQEPGDDGDAYAALLVASPIPVLQGTWDKLRGMGRKDLGLDYCAPGSLIHECITSGVN